MIDSELVIARNAKAFRYRCPAANHVLVIDTAPSPPAPGLRGFADFAAFYASRYAEVWCLDETAAFLDSEGRAQRMMAIAEHVATTDGAPPIFVMGVLEGGAAACQAVSHCPAVRGALLIGPVHIPGHRGAAAKCQLKRNGSVPPPTLRIIGGDAPRSDRAVLESATEAELYIHEGRLVGLTNSPSGLAAVIYEWCSRQMNNHLNPRWWK